MNGEDLSGWNFPVLAQLRLHYVQFSATDIAELAQEVLAFGPELNFLGSKVRLRIRNNNVLNNAFSALKHIRRRTQTNTAQKSVCRDEFIRVLEIMLDGISHCPRAFTDEV